MVLLLGGMGIFFFFNYRLLSLLEREDWPALAYYLEQKIYSRGRFSMRYVRLLASSYLVMTDYQSVLKLESKTMLFNPSIVSKNALLFGTARVLSGNHKDAAVFFKTCLEKDNNKIKAKDRQWIRWFYGFSQLLSGSFDKAEPDFSALAVSSSDALITGLSAYFLTNSIAKYLGNSAECLAAAQSGRIRVVNVIKNNNGWKNEVEKMSSDIHIAIIMKYINETGNWLFPEPASREAALREPDREVRPRNLQIFNPSADGSSADKSSTDKSSADELQSKEKPRKPETRPSIFDDPPVLDLPLNTNDKED